MAIALLSVGYVLCFIGELWIIVLAWEKGILWGVGCLLFPAAQLVYVALNWKQAKSPFFVLLAGFAAFFISDIFR